MFSSDLYSDVRRPLLQAHTLPSHCYSSPEFLEREKHKIFQPGWHFAGRKDEISTPGDYLLVDTIVGSALVVRHSNGDINAFTNACRHRGTRLKDVSGTCRQIVCPYHSWTYETDGLLRAAPGMDGVENFNKDNFGLKPLRLQDYGGFLFLSFSDDGVNLLDSLGNFSDFFDQHDSAGMRCTGRLEFSVEANWKFLITNALEAYHTGSVHKDTLGQQESESVEATGNWDALYVKSSDSKSIGTLPGEQQALPFISTLSAKAKNGTWFSVIYPCTQIVFAQDCVWWLDIKPVSASQTKLSLGGCFPESTIALKDFEKKSRPYFQRWSKATVEDNRIAESQQQGSTAGMNLAGRYAPTEHCVHKLDNWVLDRVLG